MWVLQSRFYFERLDSVVRRKDAGEIGEVTKAAWAEGDVNHVNITGGCINPKREITIVSEIFESIREYTGFDTVPGTLLPSPAKGDAIDKYFENRGWFTLFCHGGLGQKILRSDLPG